jgi:tetratricopeptide (TPR) repeat protein
VSGTRRREPLPPWVKRLLRLPSFFLQFVSDWWSTRYWSSLVWGGLVIVAALSVWSVAFLHRRIPQAEWQSRYAAWGRAALDGGDWMAAEVHFGRIAFRDPSSTAGLHGLAQIAELRGDDARARDLMRRIAPEDRAGHADAHFWLAQDMIRRKVPVTPDALRLLEHHLQQALRSDSSRQEARVLLAQLYAAQGEPEQAIQELRQVVPERPELQLELAQQYLRAGREPEARRAAANAEEFFQARTQAEPEQPQHRLGWATSHLLRQHYEDAIRVLEQGLTLDEPRPFQQALAAAHFRWLDALEQQGELSSVKQLELLEQVCRYDPGNQRALTMIGNLAMSEDSASEQAIAVLQQQGFDWGTAPAEVHLVVGTRELRRGNFERGVKHLERAYELNPRFPEVLNNLAWGLAHQDHPDLERALEVAEAAQRLSKGPETYDTLGTILMKLGRPREALVQLETALRLLPGRPALHHKLADVYQQLGNDDLAAEHRRLADKLETPH